MNKQKLSILIASLVLAIFSVVLFYKAGLGINFLIFNIFLSFGIALAALMHKRMNLSLVVNITLLVLLSIPFVFTTSSPVRSVLFLSWLYFLFITFQTLVQKNWLFEFWRYIVVPVEQFAVASVCPILPISKLTISTGKNTKASTVKIILRICLGIFIAMPFLITFIALLASADLAFREILGNIFSQNFIKDLIGISLRLVIGFWFIFGLFYYNLFKKSEYVTKQKQEKKKSSMFFIESVTILALVEILFLIFNIVQLAYLFGGESLIQTGSFTYSEYARRGFFELVAVSVIALCLMAALFKIKKTKTNLQEIIIRGLGLCGIFELIPMTVSAFYRLYLYEDEYGFTQLRVYSHLFIIYLIIVFIWFVIKFLSKLKEKIFLYGIELISVICLIVVGLINVDSTISSYNIQRYKNASYDLEKLDLAYLYTLSYDSVPKLVELFKQSNGESKAKVALYLKGKYDALLFETKQEDLREYNIRKYNAKNLLEKNIDEIANYSSKYEDKVLQEYKYLQSTFCSDYSSDNNCSGQVSFCTIEANGFEKYPSNISIYSFDNPAEIVMDDYTYYYSDCYALDKGKYFVIVNRYELLGSGEVFIIEVESIDQEIFLVSRKD